MVFVADSQEERLDANFETMENLMEHLKEHNLNFATIPYVLMLNKRDLPNAMSVAELTKQLQKKGEPVLEGVAIQGLGVFETLKEVAKLVLAELKTASILLDEEVISASSGKKIHRMVVKKAGLEIRE